MKAMRRTNDTPLRFSLRDSTIAVLAVPVRPMPGKDSEVDLSAPGPSLRRGVVAALEGIGTRATLDPERWPAMVPGRGAR